MSSERPLSPHLQIYRPQITSISSILHRFSAVVLVFGFIALCVGLICLTAGGSAFSAFTSLMTTKVGWLFLFGWSAAFFYHACTGIRHMIFDAGFLFAKKNAAASGYVVIGMAVILTLTFWLVIV